MINLSVIIFPAGAKSTKSVLGTTAWTLDSVLAAANILATLFHNDFCRKLMSIVLSVSSGSPVDLCEWSNCGSRVPLDI